MSKKLIAVICMVIIAVTAFTGCSATAATRPVPDEGAETYVITGECSAKVDGDKLVVTGKCDIEPGTNGYISVYSATGLVNGIQKIVQEEENGEITVEFPITKKMDDEVYAFLVFDTSESDSQPDEIKEMYGDKFQNIVGDESILVWSSTGIAVCMQSELVSIR